MASSHCSIALLCLLVLCFIAAYSVSSTSLYYDEQESLYQVLDSINSGIDWRSLFPDNLCNSAPHGIVCDYFSNEKGTITPHITELNFGYVSDFSPNPPCTFNSMLSPRLSSFIYLRKLFFYRCFTETQVSFPGFLSTLGSTLEELVFIENPSMVGTLTGKLGNFRHLRRFILTGTSVFGEIVNSAPLVFQQKLQGTPSAMTDTHLSVEQSRIQLPMTLPPSTDFLLRSHLGIHNLQLEIAQFSPISICRDLHQDLSSLIDSSTDISDSVTNLFREI